MNGNALKQANTKAVIKELLSESSSTRIEISRKLGLSKMTVTNIVSALLKDGFFVENKLEGSEIKGRPAVALSLAPNAPKTVSVYLSPERITIRIESLSLKQTSERNLEIGESRIQDYEKILLEGLDQTFRESINTKIIGIGISVRGNVNCKEGIIEDKEHYFGREEIEILSTISSRYPLPVSINSSTDCFAMAESYYGIGKNEPEALYINILDKVESTIVHEGELLKSSSKFGCQIAHISIDYNGLSCSCGNRGCLETYISSDVMVKKIRDITKMRLDFKGFCELQNKKNDSRIDWALKDMMDKMAAALVGYCSLFHPGLIVLGGDGFYIPDRYLAKLEKNINEKTSKFNEVSIKVRKPMFKNETMETGAILPLAMNYFETEL